jgi:hypothetical protein
MQMEKKLILLNTSKLKKLSVDGKYEVKTTEEWDVPNATRFLRQTVCARTMTITATDSGGLNNTASTIINEDSIVVKKGLIESIIFQKLA